MRLLLLDQFSDPGGAQQALLELLPALRARGWEACVGMPGAGELFDRVEALGVETARVACGPYRSGRKSWSDAGRFVLGTSRLAAQIRKLARDADLIHVNGPRLLPGVALAGAGVPVLFQSHSYLAPGAVRALAGAGVRRAHAAVAAVCEFVAAPWREFAGASRVRVIYNGVAGPALPLWRGGSAVVSCIGRIAPEKGQVEFLQAARRIAAAVPEARFVIHGAALFDDAGAARYEQRVRADASGLPVDFAGWSSDIYASLSALDLLLVPSTGPEATPRVILEALAAGVPVIAFRRGGIAEVLAHGRTGWLANSVEEMAALAVDALRSPHRMAEVSSAGRAEWEARFTQQRYQRELMALMEQVAARSD